MWNVLESSTDANNVWNSGGSYLYLQWHKRSFWEHVLSLGNTLPLSFSPETKRITIIRCLVLRSKGYEHKEILFAHQNYLTNNSYYLRTPSPIFFRAELVKTQKAQPAGYHKLEPTPLKGCCGSVYNRIRRTRKSHLAWKACQRTLLIIALSGF